MTQTDDLVAAVAANTAAVAELTAALPPLDAAIAGEIARVQELLNLLGAGPTDNPAVAQAITDLQASTSALQAAQADVATHTASLTADDVPPAP